MGLFNKKSVSDGGNGSTFDGQMPGSTSQGVVGGTILWRPSSNDELVWKYPYDNIKRGAPMVVHESQEGLVYYNGELSDIIRGGTRFTFDDSCNIPFISRIMNVATGGETSYTAEVWFTNVQTKRKISWGVGMDDGLMVLDAGTGLEFPIGINGDYALRIVNSREFILKLVGTKHSASIETVYMFFKNNIKSTLIQTIVEMFEVDGGMKIGQLNSRRETIQTRLESTLNAKFTEQYGIEISEFAIAGFMLDEYRKITQAQIEGAAEQRRLQQLGVNYTQERQLNIMETAAGNEGAGVTMGAGMGMGMGFGMGNTMGSMMQNTMGQVGQMGQAPPPLPGNVMFYAFINGTQNGPMNLVQMREMASQRRLQPDTLVWCQGMQNWSVASTVPELADIFGGCPPPPPIL